MSQITEFCGGPWDGIRRTVARDPGEIVWLGGSPNDRRMPVMAKTPREDRAPYMVKSKGKINGVRTRTYVFVGHRMFACHGCGVLHARRNADGSSVDHCDLCGEPVAA